MASSIGMADQPSQMIDLPESCHAQTMAFDLVISGELPAGQFLTCFVHGRVDVVHERRQAVFIDVHNQGIYTTIWHNDLQREIILWSKLGYSVIPRKISIVF